MARWSNCAERLLPRRDRHQLKTCIGVIYRKGIIRKVGACNLAKCALDCRSLRACGRPRISLENEANSDLVPFAPSQMATPAHLSVSGQGQQKLGRDVGRASPLELGAALGNVERVALTDRRASDRVDEADRSHRLAGLASIL
jgi:hypothetical protein